MDCWGMNQRPLTLREVLSWADAYRESVGAWPSRGSGPIAGTIGETWRDVDTALRHGWRGLPGSTSLARLLAEERGARNPFNLTALDEEQILHWADSHHERTGAWPHAKSGKICESGGETWAAVSAALLNGTRGLSGGSSLAQLLARRRGARNRGNVPRLTEEQILRWADAYRTRSGCWPSGKSGPIEEAPGETWTAVDMALRHGKRGMPGGSSLAFLLAERRNVRNVWTRPNLSVELILGWADAHFQRTGCWPTVNVGLIEEAPKETWRGVDRALRRGARGFPGGSSLARLLSAERNVRNVQDVARLTRRQILAWADNHRRRTGKWPTHTSGPVADNAGEVWQNVDAALREGLRGLRGGSSLAQLLARHRGRRNIHGLPDLSKKQILRWADAHFQQTGSWPHRGSGPITGASSESWRGVDQFLRNGGRGLAGRSSLGRLLAAKRGARPYRHSPSLTEEQILRWADEHFQRVRTWPQLTSGPIPGVPGETWSRINHALREGKRGLLGHSSLALLLAEKRGLPYWPRRRAAAGNRESSDCSRIEDEAPQ